MAVKKRPVAKKPPDKDNKNNPSMYQDPMRNIAAGGTGHNPDKGKLQPQSKKK